MGSLCDYVETDEMDIKIIRALKYSDQEKL